LTYLLDTNALSEPGRPSPNLSFMDWYLARESAEFRLSAVSVGELRRGVSLLPAGDRRRGVQALYANIVHRFSAQILAVDASVAEVWGDLSAKLKLMGHVIGTADELIAATAIAHGLVLVTRNQRHFEACGCQIHLPWSP
jgi:predicted nucleic acid-binding protein